ncbi:hypothetical protein [Bradyrhizobium sp.]|uniref:hypothetical protein n=1 Tax=Bradyrhizobium sp. TaxID=376 RepID=UPI003C748F87
MTDDEILTLRATIIGGKRWPDDYTVIWRTLPIGRIMLAPGLPPHVPQWRWPATSMASPEAAAADQAMISMIASGSFVRHGQRRGRG